MKNNSHNDDSELPDGVSAFFWRDRKRDNIIATLTFFDIFDFPLKKEEVEKYLLKKIPKHMAQNALQTNALQKEISERDGYICLKGREKIFDIRKEREHHAKKLWKKVNRYAGVMQTVPFVRMAAVCNNLAYNNPSATSDIDLFIICKENRLFTARTLLTLLLHILGVRRHHKKVKGRFCLSFFISESHYDLETIRLKPHDIYLAYWFKTLKPLFGFQYAEKFQKENNEKNSSRIKVSDTSSPQVRAFRLKGANGMTSTLQMKCARTMQKVLEWPLSGRFGSLVEKYLKNWQIKRARLKAKKLNKHFPEVVIEKNILKFHDQDKRKEYQKVWEDRMRAYSKTNKQSNFANYKPKRGLSIKGVPSKHRNL